MSGFAEGTALPLLEILFSFLVVLLTALQQAVPILSPAGGTGFNVPLMLFIFGMVNVVESLSLGMKRMG